MKKFLKYCLLFVLPICLIAISLEDLVRQIPNLYKYKYEWMLKNADEVETLVLGNSHTYYGIQPKYFKSKSFNLANPAQLYEQDLFLLKYWSNRCPKLKTVILPISYFTFFVQDSGNGKETFRCKNYNIYMDCDLYPSWSFSYNFEIADPRVVISKLYKYTLGIKGQDRICDIYGNEAYNTLAYRTSDWDKYDKNTIESTFNLDYIQKNLHEIEQIISLCKEKNINLIFVTTPCWHTYRSYLNEDQLNKLYSIIHKLQRKYEISYFDFFQDERFNAEDFFNSSHLSELGEMKLTKILESEINKLENKKNI